MKVKIYKTEKNIFKGVNYQQHARIKQILSFSRVEMTQEDYDILLVSESFSKISNGAVILQNEERPVYFPFLFRIKELLTEEDMPPITYELGEDPLREDCISTYTSQTLANEIRELHGEWYSTVRSFIFSKLDVIYGREGKS